MGPMLTPGQTVERYTVEAVIGQGGMAVVYRVRHNSLGSLHALKILTVPKPNIRERLLAEGRAQAVIRHPNVVSVTDVLELGGSPALLMEYVEGPTLEAWLEAEVPPLNIAEELFRGICAGVGEAHLHGMVHRDLKPSNVLLAPRSSVDPNQGYIPKVTDFGIAKVLAGDDFEKKTRTNVAMGTPHYMAPEQIRDAKSVDQRADVFSLGCLLYELVCGVRPFDGNDVLMILNAVASGKYEPPRNYVPDLPDRFDNAIRRCLEIDRDVRLQSCQSIMTVLSGQEPVEVRLPTWIPGSTESEVRASPGLVGRAGEQAAPPSPSALVTPPSMSTTYNAGTEALYDDTGGSGLSKETPSLPVDSNAMTVPRPQRVETPLTPSDREAAASVRRSLGLAVALLAVLAGLTGIGLFGYLQDPTQHQSGRAEDDGSVLGFTEHAWAPLVEILPPPDLPEETAPPGILVDPSKRPPPTVVHTDTKVPEGLGLFAPKDKPPAQGFGRVQLVGDVKSDLYVHGIFGTPVAKADLPPGKYDVRAKFAGQEAKVALEVDLKAGQVLIVECSSTRNLCQKRD
jgi:eukaryotic-like serine/threonine-protein kinase